MNKIKEKYKNTNIFFIIFICILHGVSVLIRGTLFILVKLIYKIFRLYQFERIKDDVYLTKSDGLSHNFNFKRSPYFKQKYHEIFENLNYYKIVVKADIDNGTNDSDEVLGDIEDELNELIILTEKESMSRAFNFACRKKKGLRYSNNGTDFLDFYMENTLNGYNDVENDLNNLK